MESFLLDAWIREMRPLLVGQRLFAIRCQEDGPMALDFGRRIGSLLLLLKPGRVCAALAPDSRRKQGRSDGPMRLPDAVRVVSLERFPDDRILHLALETSQGPGCMVLELVPSAPNLLLLDESDRVLALHSGNRDRRRMLAPGHPYQPPPIPGRRALEQACAEGGLPEEPADLERWLVRNVVGMGPLLAAELVYRAAGSAGRLQEAADSLQDEPASAQLYEKNGSRERDWRAFDPWAHLEISPLRLRCREAWTATAFPSVNAALLQCIEMAEESRHFLQLRGSRLRALKALAARQERALLEIEEDCRRMEDPERYRLQGELLLANLQAARSQWPSLDARAGDAVRVVDYYAEEAPTVSIPVNPRKSPQANAEDFFKAYRKARRGREGQLQRRAAYRKALARTLALEQSLEAARDLAALTPLLKQGPRGRTPAFQRSATRRSPRVPGRRVYTSSDGFEILVGQSAVHNEELTFRVAASHDQWLHVADFAGSHVIIRNPGRRELPRRTLVEAAQLAAHFSAARWQSKVEVRYTERKYVSKLKGAAPGLVRLQRFKSLLVQPRRVIGAQTRASGDPPFEELKP